MKAFEKKGIVSVGLALVVRDDINVKLPYSCVRCKLSS